LSGDFPLESWEVLVTLLHDDDAYIRDIAAHSLRPISLRSILTPSCEVQHVFFLVYQCFYRKHPNTTLKWLLGWIINHSTPREAQINAWPSDQQSEIDLLFERNSLNSYRERVTLALDATKCLKKIATEPHSINIVISDGRSTHNAVLSYDVTSTYKGEQLVKNDVTSVQIEGDTCDRPAQGDVKSNMNTNTNDVTDDVQSPHVETLHTDVYLRPPNDVIDHQNDVLKEFTLKCVNRLQFYLHASELDVTTHFYDLLANVLGLVVDGYIKLSNENLRNVQLDPGHQRLIYKQSLSKEDTSELTSHIRDIVSMLTTDVKLGSFLCHPVMDDAVKDLCHLYDINFKPL